MMMVGWFCSCWLPWSWPSSEPEVTWFGQLRIFSPKPQRKRCSPPRWRAARQQQHSWIDGVLRSTCLPFLLVLVLAGALGWSVHHHCPTALKLVDVFRCPVQLDSSNPQVGQEAR